MEKLLLLSYQKKIVIVSISLHVIALIALMLYWIFFPNQEVVQTQEPNKNSVSTQNTKRDIPDTGKSPHEDYSQGDLKNKQINKILIDSIDVEPFNEKEKTAELESKFEELSKTSVKEIQTMAELVAKSAGAQIQKSKQPATVYTGKETIDIDSLKLQDYEVTEDKQYILIFKDKNNVFIKNGPYKFEDIDESLKPRLKIVMKAKENKKMRILLDVTDSIMDNLFNPKEPTKSATHPKSDTK